MVALSLIVLIAAAIYTVYTMHARRREQKQYEERQAAFEERLAELAVKRDEALDVWKKACWAAEKKVNEYISRYEEKETLLSLTQAELAKVVNQKKSSEVKLGMVSENVLGFISDLPYNFQNMRQLGSPIDYVYFNLENPDEAEIVFVEVKSNKSKESKKQRIIRSAVLSGRVYYEVVRLDSEGINIKRS